MESRDKFSAKYFRVNLYLRFMNTVTNQNAGDVLNYIFKYLIKVELENTLNL